MKFTETRKAWITEYTDPDSIKPGNTGSLILCNGDMTDSGWSVIGSATVEVELLDHKTMVANKVESLEAQLKDEMAAAQVRQMGLRKKIAELLAITHEVTA